MCKLKRLEERLARYRMEGSVTVQLYSVSNFYAELYYENAMNENIRTSPFNSKDLLGAYLEYFDFVIT